MGDGVHGDWIVYDGDERYLIRERTFQWLFERIDDKPEVPFSALYPYLTDPGWYDDDGEGDDD